MQVIYSGPYEAVVDADGVVFPQGQPVEVDDAVGANLLNQGFSNPVVSPAPAPAPVEPAPAPTDGTVQ